MNPRGAGHRGLDGLAPRGRRSRLYFNHSAGMKTRGLSQCGTTINLALRPSYCEECCAVCRGSATVTKLRAHPSSLSDIASRESGSATLSVCIAVTPGRIWVQDCGTGSIFFTCRAPTGRHTRDGGLFDCTHLAPGGMRGHAHLFGVRCFHYKCSIAARPRSIRHLTSGSAGNERANAPGSGEQLCRSA